MSEEAELARLREQVAKLEALVADVEEWANRAVVDAQAKSYWLDRWHVDLNAIMSRPSMDRARAAARGVRSASRGVRRLLRRVRP